MFKMNSIIDAALDRSRMIILAFMLILIAGFSTYISIPKEEYFFTISGVIAIRFSIFWFSKTEPIFIYNLQ